MKLIQSFLTNNPCYKKGVKIKPKGCMLHSVGCPQSDANVFIKKWNKASYTRACVHGFIDANIGDVYQTLPWDMRGWHCGSGKKGSGNNTHIGVELCEPDCIKYTKGSKFTCSDLERARTTAKRTYASAVELFADLCEKYGWNPMEDGVIIGHAEGYKRGIASNHGDPEHLWNGLGLPYTMDTFRQDVKKAMDAKTQPAPEPRYYRVRKSWGDKESQIGAFSDLDNAKDACKDGYIVFDSEGNEVYLRCSQKQFILDVQEATGSKPDGIAGEETIGNTITVSATINYKHPVVIPLQKRLKVLGYYTGKIDGIAGPKFAKAVTNLQKDIGAYADGVITRGNKTWQWLLGML